MTWGQPTPYAAVAPQAHPARTGRTTLRRWLLSGFLVVGFLLAALVLAVYYGATLGVVTTLLAVMLAVLPLGIVVPTFLWLDRFEAEPSRYLVVAFLWGALVAALAAGIVNTGANIAFQAATGSAGAGMLATAIFSAPLVEEAAKGLLVLLVWRFRRREFDGITDGMVYAGIVAAGFAFTENIQYLGLAYQHGGGEALTGTFVARAVFTPFAHPIFTVMTGIGVGIAASTRNRFLKVVAPVAGYLLAAMLHSLWNLGAVTGGQGMVATYLVVEVPIFLGFVILVVWVRRREGRLIGRYLSPYADAGWLSPSEVAMLSTMSGRRSARLWAKAHGGRGALRAMEGFQDAASELALLRVRMHHSAADQRALDHERSLLEALSARRHVFLGG